MSFLETKGRNLSNQNNDEIILFYFSDISVSFIFKINF